MFQLKRVLPCAALRDLVDTYYLVEVDCPPGEVLQDMLLPELPNIRMQLEGQWYADILDRGFEPIPKASLFGFTHAPLAFRVGGKSRVFGLGLTPLGWQSLVGRPAADYADLMVDLADFYGADIHTFMAAMRGHDTIEDMAPLMDAALMKRQKHVSPQKCAGLARFLEVLGHPDSETISRVDDLAERLGLSIRQVERSAREFFGCSPKLLLRKHRFLSMLARNPDGDAAQSWIETADESFYDQSHYIREYRRFTGQSPRQFAKSQNILQMTVAKTLKDVPDRKPSSLALKLDLSDKAS